MMENGVRPDVVHRSLLCVCVRVRVWCALIDDHHGCHQSSSGYSCPQLQDRGSSGSSSSSRRCHC